jgi:hypothetical protein
MKKMLLLVALFAGLQCFAAPPDYIVYYVKGSCTRTAPAKALKRGDVLQAKDSVVLGDRSELLLLCKDYRLVRIAKKGSHILERSAPCAVETSSVTATYFKYVWEELKTVHGSPEKNPRHYMRNKGAVSRSGCPAVFTALSTDTIYHCSGDLDLLWRTAITAPWLSSFPDDHDPLALKQVELIPGTPIKTSQLARMVDEDSVLIWAITEKKTDVCDRKYFRLLSAANYRERVQILLQQVIVTTPAQTAFMKAWVLEENHFPAEAMKYYAKAVKLDPKNSTYKSALKHFYEIN